MSGVISPFQALDPQIWEPSDNALVDAVFDTASINATTLLIAGTLYLMRMVTKRPVLLTNLEFFNATPGAGASTGSFGGVYSASGLLLSGSADIGALLLVANRLPIPLTTPQNLVAGQVTYRAILVNLATTQPTLAVGSNNNTVRFNNPVIGPAAGLRASVNGTGLAALPANINPAANVGAGAFALWTGGS